MKPPSLAGAWLDLRLLAATLLVAVLTASFAGVYGFRWWDEDSSINVVWIREVSYQGSFTRARSMYANGYGYHVASSIYTQIAGIDPAPYIQLLNPLLGAVFFAAIVGAAYRIGTGRPPGLALALAIATPEVLFVYSRGTHEKMSISLLILLLVLFRLLDRPRVDRGSWAATAIILAFGLSTMNGYFAILPALILASILVLVIPLWRLLARDPLTPAAQYSLSKLLSQPSTLLLIATLPLVNVAYLIRGYALVTAGYRELFQKFVEGLFQNLFVVQQDVVGAYGIRAAYSTPVFFLLETPSLLAVLVSAAWFLYKLARKQGLEPYEVVALGVPALLVVALPVDLAGGFFGSKTLIVRMIPLTVVFLAPVYARALESLQSRLGRRWMIAVILLVLVFSGLALLKATRSPLVSTHIPYYTIPEESGMNYTIAYNTRYNVFIDTRLGAVLYINEPSVDYHYTYVKPGSPRHIYVKDPAEAHILLLSGEIIERGYYDGLYTVPLDVFLEEKTGKSLEEILAVSSPVYSGGGTTIIWTP